MKPGDLIRLNSQGNPVWVAPHPWRHTPWPENIYPPGTLAVIIEIEEVGKDGPGMETQTLVMVNNLIGWVWLYECEEIR
jgi:hypothetical protein